MKPVKHSKAPSEYQKAFRGRMTAMGLVRKDAWILPEHALVLARVIKALQHPQSRITIEEGHTTMDQKIVGAQALCHALQEKFDPSAVEVGLLEGVDPAILCTMKDHGGLPVVVGLSGEVVIAQATLWPESQVKDLAALNREIMLAEKLFGLANVSLERIDGEVWYVAYGALRAQSAPEDIAYEIEALAHAVLDIAQTFKSHLN
jgi:hypothetical protein